MSAPFTAHLRAEASRLEALVWNQADDPDFLDQALCCVLDDALHEGPYYVAQLARLALYAIARDLRTQMPERLPVDLPDIGAAA